MKFKLIYKNLKNAKIQIFGFLFLR